MTTSLKWWHLALVALLCACYHSCASIEFEIWRTIMPCGVEIAPSSWNQFLLNLKHCIFVQESLGYVQNRSLVCTCKLSKVCCLKNIWKNGCQEWKLSISVENWVCRSKYSPKHSENFQWRLKYICYCDLMLNLLLKVLCSCSEQDSYKDQVLLTKTARLGQHILLSTVWAQRLAAINLALEHDSICILIFTENFQSVLMKFWTYMLRHCRVVWFNKSREALVRSSGWY